MANLNTTHHPHRGDAVELWLRQQRDRYPRGSDGWHVLDVALDDYRMHGDAGVALAPMAVAA